MTTAGYSPAQPRRGRSRSGATVEIAGTRWPLYKLEALVVGLLTFLVVLALAQALQPAVLAAAAVTVTVWWARRLYWSNSSS
ncbi:hypothetical protein FK531_09085 [Rhodococcus spelaei]|uniref:Uncharacterized protein n=1 Tax=Rhodococcus spelaei TaxID=2546320 RepID=A0A541BMW6_9NOCA|nr:hypothetical protein [Rhodococcus spelaei]TQF73614.1 hypothetical protein FK531_09085 [Rhodococcus spelaei]